EASANTYQSPHPVTPCIICFCRHAPDGLQVSSIIAFRRRDSMYAVHLSPSQNTIPSQIPATSHPSPVWRGAGGEVLCNTFKKRVSLSTHHCFYSSLRRRRLGVRFV